MKDRVKVRVRVGVRRLLFGEAVAAAAAAVAAEAVARGRLGEAIEVRGEGPGAHLSDLRLGLIDRLLRPRGPFRARLDGWQRHIAEQCEPRAAGLRSSGGGA